MEQITGRVTADAKVNTVNGDRQVVNFSVAVNNRYKTKSGEKVESTRFFKCDYWNRPGIAPYLKKGALVELAGVIDLQVWLTDGIPKGTLTMRVNDLKLLLTTRSETTTAKTVGQPATVTADDDLPF